MTENEARAMLAQMNEDEKRELLTFVRFLLKRQKEGREVTEQEVQEMLEAARKRLGK